jgi:hypothetical protein
VSAGGLALAAYVTWSGSASGAAGAGAPIEEARVPPASTSSTWTRACSTRHGLCLNAAPPTTTSAVLSALDSLDRAWDVETQALGLPAPEAGASGGADGRWNAYLVDDVREGGRAALTGLDPRGTLDRGSSIGLIDRALGPGCLLDRAAARAVAWASLLREAPATDGATALAETRMLAALSSPCAGPDGDDRAFQSEPETALLDASDESRASGASLFFDWLDASFASEPGALVAGTWSLSPSQTPPGAWRWPGKPQGFDVIARSLGGAFGTDSDLDDVFLQFAVHRALIAPAPRAGWHVPWPSKARRLASPVAVATGGAAYVVVDHAGAAAGASLRVEARWEDYGRMKWAVIKLDPAGRPLAVLPISSPPRATSAALTVELIDAVDHFVVVGANVGSTEHPFDPSQGWWEPHGWVLTVSPG